MGNSSVSSHESESIKYINWYKFNQSEAKEKGWTLKLTKFAIMKFYCTNHPKFNLRCGMVSNNGVNIYRKENKSIILKAATIIMIIWSFKECERVN